MDILALTKQLKFIATNPIFNGTVPIIAGGFIRDSITGKPVKDIDCFINQGYKNHLPADLEWTAKEDYKDSPIGITNTTTIKVPEIEYPLNIILTSGHHNLRSLLNKFNFGICRISYDSFSGLYVTNHFLSDIENKTLTCFQKKMTPEIDARCQQHYERLLEKYPDFELVETYKLGLYNPNLIWE